MLIPIPHVFLILPTTKDISEMKRGQTIKRIERIERIKTIIKFHISFWCSPQQMTTHEFQRQYYVDGKKTPNSNSLWMQWCCHQFFRLCFSITRLSCVRIWEQLHAVPMTIVLSSQWHVRKHLSCVRTWDELHAMPGPNDASTPITQYRTSGKRKMSDPGKDICHRQA